MWPCIPTLHDSEATRTLPREGPKPDLLRVWGGLQIRVISPQPPHQLSQHHSFCQVFLLFDFAGMKFNFPVIRLFASRQQNNWLVQTP